jgi:hypothetical protein
MNLKELVGTFLLVAGMVLFFDVALNYGSFHVADLFGLFYLGIILFVLGGNILRKHYG